VLNRMTRRFGRVQDRRASHKVKLVRRAWGAGRSGLR